MIKMSNNKDFIRYCLKLKIKPTARQERKYQNKVGIFYNAIAQKRGLPVKV